MTVKQYTLTLTHTTWGSTAPGHNPKSVAVRRARAIKVAKRNDVTGWDGTPIKDNGVDIVSTNNGAIWKVKGEDDDICDMLAIWKRHNNVTVTGGPTSCPW
jgi:hypothetical protein